ncbi:MAG TPA: zf-HC2 domain-containing protein [Gemmatimonadaceae bacterium]|nr:zf-HC2 domain-containing protein [Gemmatimonadaceae bacterium]
MQHPDEGTIHAWLDGALTADEAARVDAHVKDCAQCQAAVAEARGFIAASSRILTALDNVPRGVIPAAAEKSRLQPWVWRVAATVLVVAGATLVLVERKETSYKQTAAYAPASDTQLSTPPTADSVTLSQPTSGISAENAPATFKAATPQAVPATPRPTGKPVPQPSAQSMNSAVLGKRVDEIREAQSPERAVVSDQRRVAAADRNRLGATAQDAAPTLMVPPGVVMDAAETTPRVVETKRAIGRTQTFYELATGDTVMLEEQFGAQLEGVVANGAAKRAQALSGRAAGQAAAAPERQEKAVATAAPPPPPVALQDAQSSEIHRISWLDRSTGRVLILSGRHSQEELERIREKIQELRDAARAKRNPE